MILARHAHLAAIAALLAACTQPGGPGPSAGTGASGTPATTCQVNGFFMGNRLTPRAASTMFVSNDGVCAGTVSAQGGSSTGVAASITPVVQPQHGRLATRSGWAREA